MVAKRPGSGQVKRGKSFPPGGRSPAVAGRWAEAVRLRLAGARLVDIAAELGYADESGAKRAVEGGLRESLRTSEAEALRAVDCERLEALHHAHWAAATAGDLDAGEFVLRTMARRARLLGLDAPTRVLDVTPATKLYDTTNSPEALYPPDGPRDDQ